MQVAATTHTLLPRWYFALIAAGLILALWALFTTSSKVAGTTTLPNQLTLAEGDFARLRENVQELQGAVRLGLERIAALEVDLKTTKTATQLALQTLKTAQTAVPTAKQATLQMPCSSWQFGLVHRRPEIDRNVTCNQILLTGSDLDASVARAVRGTRVFFIGNSITREFMFETQARLTNSTMTGDVHGRKYSCGNPNDIRDRFPNCPLYVGPTNTTLAFHWYQHYVQHDKEGYLEGCANAKPAGVKSCFERLFGSKKATSKDIAVFLLNVQDAAEGTTPSAEDRSSFLRNLHETFDGLSVFVLPCLYNMRSVNTPNSNDTNIHLARLNHQTAQQFNGIIRMVEINDICEANYAEFYDALHAHPRVSRLLMDRIWNVILRALKEREEESKP